MVLEERGQWVFDKGFPWHIFQWQFFILCLKLKLKTNFKFYVKRTMPIYGILILRSSRRSPTPWVVAQPSQFRSILEENEFGRVPQIYLYHNLSIINVICYIHKIFWWNSIQTNQRIRMLVVLENVFKIFTWCWQNQA